jgi:galactokinase
MNKTMTSECDPSEMSERFKEMYAGTPILVRAPGRVNLIGEHTDYNDGFVFPAAIGFETIVAIGPRDGSRLAVYSENYQERVEFDLDELPAARRGHWSDYVVGIAQQLQRNGSTLRGANLLLRGDVPLGAGLSSSASLEVAICKALLEVSERSMDGDSVAQLCQRAENEFVGARCGIMDQFISVHGKKDHALLLDCRSLKYELLPIPTGVRLVICNSMVRHSVAEGAYNERRAECEAGARYFAERMPGVKALRDVSLEDFDKFGGDLPENIRKRCRHVITENSRMLQAAEALKVANLTRFGELMLNSHASLRDDFAASCEEIDLLVRIAESCPGVYGVRMTGGGFGGCTINLVDADRAGEFRSTILQEYERATGRVAEIYVTSAADGAGPILQNTRAGQP